MTEIALALVIVVSVLLVVAYIGVTLVVSAIRRTFR